MSLVGFKAQNHPQQVKARQSGNDRRWHATEVADDRAITLADFGLLHERFRFTVDAAAAPHNARLPRYWTREDSALEQDWRGERVWCNPPYSDIRPWVEHAWQMYDTHEWHRVGGGTLYTKHVGFRFCSRCDREEWDNGIVRPGPSECRRAELIVMLVPANRTEQRWWQELVEPARRQHLLTVEFLPGRMRFLRPGQTEIGPNERPPFGCCLLIWGAA
jgi:hypothetical protein